MVVLYVSLTNLWRQLLQNEAFLMHDLYNYVWDISSTKKRLRYKVNVWLCILHHQGE